MYIGVFFFIVLLKALHRVIITFPRLIPSCIKLTRPCFLAKISARSDGSDPQTSSQVFARPLHNLQAKTLKEMLR